MARDFFLVKQNILKLVRASGQKPQTNADAFFSRQMAREVAYESKFATKTPKVSTSPTKVEPKKSESSGLGFGIMGILGTLGGLLSGVASTFGKIVGSATLLGTALTTLFLAVSTVTGAIFKVLGFIFKSRIGKILGLGALGAYGLGKLAEAQASEMPGITDSGANNTGSEFMQGVDSAVTYGTAGLATYGAARFAQKSLGTGGLVGKTKDAVLDARTISAEQLKKSEPTTKWGKFLKFVEKRAPKLFAKIGVRLAQAGALAAIPIVGWVASLVTLGFTLWTAWEIYSLWKEFSGSPESEESATGTSPSVVSSVAAAPTQTPTSPSQQSSSAEPTVGAGSKVKSLNNNMADLIYTKFKAAGFSDVQAEAAVANAIAESSLNPNAHNTKGEDSVGLFQMNRKGGLGQGYSVEQLKDPNTNIDLAIAAAKKSRSFVAATSREDAVASFVNDVMRPKDKVGAIAKRTEIARNLGSEIDSSSRTLASASSMSGEGVVFNDIKFIDALAKAGASSGSGTVEKAMPYDRDWYMGVVKTQAL